MAFVGVDRVLRVKGPEAGLGILARDFWDTWSSYNLTVIPMFVFMGSVAFYAGMSGRLYDAAYILFGNLARGTGHGHDRRHGRFLGYLRLHECHCGGHGQGRDTGDAAPWVRPRPGLRLYGCRREPGGHDPAQHDLHRLRHPSRAVDRSTLRGGGGPGSGPGRSVRIAVYVWTTFNPASAPAGGGTTMKQKLIGLTGLLEMLFLFVLVVGGMFAGLFSPTQAAGAGTAAAIVIGVLRRSLDLRKLWLAIKDTLLISAMIMTIVAGATVFGHFMAVTGIPERCLRFSRRTPDTCERGHDIDTRRCTWSPECSWTPWPWSRLPSRSSIPTVIALGFDPIWFGVIIVLVVEMGVITPPVGINVYIIKGVAPDVPMGKIFRGALAVLGRHGRSWRPC